MSEKVEIHRIGLDGFLRALCPHVSRGLGKPARLMVGMETFMGQHRGHIVSLGELIDWVYREDEDGGPFDAESMIRWGVMRLRERGVPIENVNGRGYVLR